MKCLESQDLGRLTPFEHHFGEEHCVFSYTGVRFDQCISRARTSPLAIADLRGKPQIRKIFPGHVRIRCDFEHIDCQCTEDLSGCNADRHGYTQHTLVLALNTTVSIGRVPELAYERARCQNRDTARSTDESG